MTQRHTVTVKYSRIALLKTRSKSALERLSTMYFNYLVKLNHVFFRCEPAGICVFSLIADYVEAGSFGTSLRFANKQKVTDAPKAPRIFLSSLSLLASIAKRRG